MPVLVRFKDRADADTEYARARLGPCFRVVDLTPAARLGEVSNLAAFSQCPSCSYVDFLKARRHELTNYVGLAPVLSVFESLPDLIAARERGGAELQALATRKGWPSIRQIVDGDARHQRANNVPTIRVVRRPDCDVAAPGTWLVEPNALGLSAAVATTKRILARGSEVWLGYLEHAVATEEWSRFIEASPASLESLAFELRDHGAPPLVMAYPACAALQWSGNRDLEHQRSRSDIVFRALERESSFMCPENVSGYSLYNDVQDSLAAAQHAQRLWIRWDDILVEVR